MTVHQLNRMKKPEAKSSRSRSSRKSTPAAGRGVWSGQLRLALVSIPVQLVSAIQSGARLSFHQIDEKSKKRIRYEKVAPGIGKVEQANIVKGFEISKGEYVFVTDEDIDKVKIEARKTIDLVQFVDHCEIDPIYFEKPYYVVPDGSLAEEAYGVLRDAMRASSKMGLGQFVMRGREYVAALKPCGQGMMLETLRFADEVREAAPFFADVEETEANEELLELAQDLIKRKTRKFDPGAFHDHYTEALRALIEAKAKHKTIVDEEVEESGKRNNVIDLVAALRQSVKANEDDADAKPAPKKISARAPARAAAPAKRRKAG
jgi:DNA end-binding protein Ku